MTVCYVYNFSRSRFFVVLCSGRKIYLTTLLSARMCGYPLCVSPVENAIHNIPYNTLVSVLQVTARF
jgi:hypothetical protein